jgi:hypothetical protein
MPGKERDDWQCTRGVKRTQTLTRHFVGSLRTLITPSIAISFLSVARKNAKQLDVWLLNKQVTD